MLFSNYPLKLNKKPIYIVLKLSNLSKFVIRLISKFAEKQQTAKRYMDVSPFFEALAEKKVRFYEFTL